MSKTHDESRYFNLFQMVDKETGEITKESRWSGSMLGDEYFVVYKQAIDRLLHDSEAPETALKIFMKLCTMQTFESAVVVSRKFLMDDLGTTRKTLWKCLSYLKEKAYIMETTVNGHSAFIINPEVSNCGKSAIPTKRKMFANNVWGDKPGFSVKSINYLNDDESDDVVHRRDRSQKLQNFAAHS